MAHPNVRCTRCGGTGQMKPTVLDRLDLAEAARAWWRADQRVTAEIEALDSVKAAHQRLTEALASEAVWLSRQPGQCAGRASPQSHAPHRPALTEEDR